MRENNFNLIQERYQVESITDADYTDDLMLLAKTEYLLPKEALVST